MPKRVSTRKKMSAPPAAEEPPARIDSPEHQDESRKAIIRDIQDSIQDIVQDGDVPGSDTALPPPAADSEEADEQGEQDEEEEDEQDEGSCYWDAATMAPLNAVSAVSTVLSPTMHSNPAHAHTGRRRPSEGLHAAPVPAMGPPPGEPPRRRPPAAVRRPARPSARRHHHACRQPAQFLWCVSTAVLCPSLSLALTHSTRPCRPPRRQSRHPRRNSLYVPLPFSPVSISSI